MKDVLKFSAKKAYQKILKHYKIEKDFRKLFKYDYSLNTHFLTFKEYGLLPFPVYLPKNFTNRPEFKNFIADLKEDMIKIRVDRGSMAGKLSLYEFIVIGLGFALAIRKLPRIYYNLPVFGQRLADAANALLSDKSSEELWFQFLDLFFIKLHKCSDFTERVYGYKLHLGYKEFRMEIVEYIPEKKYMVIDGQRRKLIQCLKYADGGSVIEALTFPSIDNNGKMYPVYFQSHATKQFMDRILDGLSKKASDSIFAAMLSTIARNPHYITHREGNTYLARAILKSFHVGYFLLTFIEDCFIVRTFLFLTMDGTPEGDRLRAQLKLTREDKAYLGLDQFRTFLVSDITEDQTLHELFIECGCGDIFELGKDFKKRNTCLGIDYVEQCATTIGNYLQPVMKSRFQKGKGLVDLSEVQQL